MLETSFHNIVKPSTSIESFVFRLLFFPDIYLSKLLKVIMSFQDVKKHNYEFKNIFCWFDLDTWLDCCRWKKFRLKSWSGFQMEDKKGNSLSENGIKNEILIFIKKQLPIIFWLQKKLFLFFAFQIYQSYMSKCLLCIVCLTLISLLVYKFYFFVLKEINLEESN